MRFSRSSWLKISVFTAILVVFVASCLFLARHYDELDACARDVAELRLACENLRSGSNLLSLHVTRYVITGDEAERNAYFREAQKVRHREEAFRILAHVRDSASVECHLRDAMTLSLELMQMEYHAMRLMVADDQSLASAPPEIRDFRLTDEEQCVTLAERQRRARLEILGDGYVAFKLRIYHALDMALARVISYAEARTVHGWAELIAFNVAAGACLLAIGWTLGSLMATRRLKGAA